MRIEKVKEKLRDKVYDEAKDEVKEEVSEEVKDNKINQSKVNKNKVKHNKVRRKIYLRTFAALMIAYLVLMAGFSVLTLNQQSKMDAYLFSGYAKMIHFGIVNNILNINIDSNNQIINKERLLQVCKVQLSSVPQMGGELAIYSGEGNLIYNTDSCDIDGKKYIYNELIDVVTDKDRIQDIINQKGRGGINRVSLVTAYYYIPMPYLNIEHVKASGDYSYACWTVMAFQSNLLKGCIKTLIYIWISCFVLFVAVALFLSNQNYKTYKKRVELDKLRSETANALAHELKTPLSIISGYAQNLVENIHTEKRDYYAENINTNVNRMDRIIREMLELSRYDIDYSKLIFEDVPLGEVCTKLMDRYSQICSDKKILVSLEGDVTVKTDFSLMERVVDNFFVNALEFTPEAGEIKIKISENKFEFFNTGSHIPEDIINEIWQPYKKEDASRNYKKGSGLGLSISAKILELYKFSYGASNIKNGVTFWFQW